MPKTSAREDGFSVLELTITVTIMSAVLASLLGVFLSMQRSQAYVTDRSEALDEIRVGMERLSKEIRQATSVSASSSAGMLNMVTYVSGTAETVTWTLTSGSLIRTNEWGATTMELRRIVNTDIFTYTPSVATPTIVKIRLLTRPKQSPNTTLELSSEVRLRNR